MSYDELVKALRVTDFADGCPCMSSCYCEGNDCIILQAADAIEQLLKAAKKMHLWIFLNSGDEQTAYDWCGLSDEMNAALGYGGQFEIRAEPPKEEI